MSIEPNRTAKVRVRLKGNADGPVFQGIEKISECSTCAKAPSGPRPEGVKVNSYPAGSRMRDTPPPIPKAHTEIWKKRFAEAGGSMVKQLFEVPVIRPAGAPEDELPSADRPPEPRQLVADIVPGIDPATIEIHTLRWGTKPWLLECGRTLDNWCERHGMKLRVWGHQAGKYPADKFCEVEMLAEFLAGDKQWLMYFDADVIFHPLAPTPNLVGTGFHILRDQPGGAQRSYIDWVRKHFHRETHPGWKYRNAGVWACDRAGAAKMLEYAKEPFIEGWQEQHSWNYWLMCAAEDGLAVHDLPKEWNRWCKDTFAGWAFHLAGRHKENKLASIRGLRFLPQRPESFRQVTGREASLPPRVPRAIVYPWLAERARWEELRYSLRSLHANLQERDAPIYILSNEPPQWLEPGGRITHIPVRSYREALAIGIQLADEVLWMNDDIALLKRLRWDDFRTVYEMGPMTRLTREDWTYHSNGWKRGVARAMDDLAHHGRGNIDCETHVPYLWEREKALEVLRTYGCWHKMPMATLYANHHRLPTVPLGNWRSSDPLADSAPVLNYVDHQITDVFKSAMNLRFPRSAPWEQAAAV